MAYLILWLDLTWFAKHSDTAFGQEKKLKKQQISFQGFIFVFILIIICGFLAQLIIHIHSLYLRVCL